MRACGLIAPADVYASRESVVDQIGYRDNINETYGLMDASGAALRDVLAGYDQDTAQDWLDFDTTYELARHTTGMLSGAAMYHWMALRGVQGSNLWVSNSAPGYKGIWDTLSRTDWDRLGGWSVVWLT